jgi:CheY-like chemotaxis protein
MAAEGRIVLADDDDVARYVTTTMLTRAGFEVVGVADGIEALEAVSASEPDIVLLDVKMPRLDGFETCRRLKADDATRHLPVLMLSATFLETEDRVEGLEGGADGYLTRPVEAPVLAATVRSLLRARRAEAAVRDAARQWRVTFDAIDDAVAVLDLDLGIERANRAFCDLAGTSPEALAGRRVTEVLPALARVVSPPADPDQPIEIEVGDRILRARANELTPEASGSTERWVLTLTDVTVARHAERLRADEFERERTISHTLQQSLLPERLPEIDGLTIAAWHVAAEDLVIGGDWYDAIETDSGLWLVIGDVAGHGVAAAAQAGQLRHSLRVYAHEGYDLASAMQALNQLVLDSGLTGFATVCIAAVDADAASLRLLSAGHPPPLLLRADGTGRPLDDGRGPALGVPREAGQPADVALRRGDRVVLYTDGLIEAPGVLLDDGIDRLLEVARATSGLDHLRESISRALIDPETLRDDIALLMAQVL